MEEKKYYTVQEVAEMLNVSDVTVRKWINETKSLRAIKIDGTIRITKEELQRKGIL